MDSEGSVIVDIRHISKSYRRGNQVIPVLDDISLAIVAGEFLALMGPSGSGKSTLLNLIAGLDRADSGAITVGGDRHHRALRNASSPPGVPRTSASSSSSTTSSPC